MDCSRGLGFPRVKRDFFALGLIVTYLVEMGFNLLSGVFGLSIPIGMVSSALSIILFVSVLPLLYAPETLPESKVRTRRLRDYLRRAMRLVEESRKRE